MGRLEQYRELIAALLVIGVALWAGWGSTRLPREGTPVAAEKWRAPVDIEAPVALDLQVIAQRRPWGFAPPPAAAQPIPSDPAQSAAGVWRIGGIVESQSVFTALVLLQKPGAQKADILNLKTGDALPDGRRITVIEATRLTVAAADNGATTEFRLFEPKK